jgi:hypothetical protein
VVLKWLRKLFATTPKTPKPAASLMELARSADEAKTRQVLAKTPIRKPAHVLAHLLDRTTPKPVKPAAKRGPAPPINLAAVMAHETAQQIRRKRPGKAVPPPVLATMVQAIEEPTLPRKPAAKAADQVPLARLNTEQEARQVRRTRQSPAPGPAAPPVAEWSRKQQLAATGGRPPPLRPDNSGLHAALSKEDAILRAMAARSAAKEPKKPETPLDQVKANKALAVKSKPG